MITRILKVRLGQALLAETKKQSKSELAAKIGVSPQTLTAMINDDWRWITRDAIERTADYLQLSATDVFEFVPVEFWRQIQESNQCTFLRGAQDERGNERGVTIQGADDEATDKVKGFLRAYMPAFTLADHRRDTEELLRRARSENCIVIGSPKSNAASEILLSLFFDAEPFNPSDDNRRKIPFGFCWPPVSKIVDQSSLTCSTPTRRRIKDRAGIAVKGGVHVEVDYKDPAAFRAWDTNGGKDSGLVFVANRPFGTDKDVKLIVLAGFSGLGTVGAAMALIEDFRYLEPNPNEKCVYGVIRCSYSKAANSNIRSFKNFQWRIRVGGGWPIKVKKG